MVKNFAEECIKYQKEQEKKLYENLTEEEAKKLREILEWDEYDFYLKNCV